MKFSLKKIKLFPRKLPFFGSGKKYGIYPDRDWRMLILCFLFVNLFLIGYLITLYYQQNIGENYMYRDSADLLGNTSIDKKLLQEILNMYEERKARIESLPEEVGVRDLSI